ncbi:DUF2357 domain-containing protein [Aquirufa antheringensis]
MRNQISEINISLDSIESGLELIIYGNRPDSLFLIEKEFAFEHGMSPYQILEGNFYNYYFSLNGEAHHSYQLKEDLIVTHSLRKGASEGRVSPNIYVGSLQLTIYNKSNNEVLKTVEIEVLATKLDDNRVPQEDSNYRKNYQFMLKDIAEKCTDLLMQVDSPVTQNFEINFNRDNETIYQRFAFVSSMINTDDFNESINKIIASPTTKLLDGFTLKDIRAVRRMNSFSVRQLASRSNRVTLNTPVGGLNNVPSKIENIYKSETTDTSENRFIKYTLEVFLQFCIDCRNTFNKNSYSKSLLEAESLIAKLENHLNQPFFREIERPTTLKLNSPALQRKSGYREILNSWLKYDLAARLIWRGGEDVYKAGKRDIAVLYEYWLFFVLYDLMRTKFKLFGTNETGKYGHLIQQTSDGLNLMLKSGKLTALEGIFNSDGKDFNLKFSYNRTFVGGTKYAEKKAGSWTKSLRPDYTLSIWPREIINEMEAEELEKIVHIHFDSKYKVQHFSIETNVEVDIDGDSSLSSDILGDSLEKEKRDERKGIFKNADLLKMHAYKDAIRRTGGAYVLYPGTENYKGFYGFHELIPGLGAFAIRPEEGNNGTKELSIFIDKIIAHFSNMASQQRRHSSSIYEIHKNESPSIINEPLPEYIIPDETYVIVAYYKSKDHFEWITNEMKYNGRIYGVKGAMNLTPEFIGAKYLLLHNKEEPGFIIYKIDQSRGREPIILPSSHPIFEKYPNSTQQFYLLFNLLEKEENYLNNNYNYQRLRGYSSNTDAYPFTCKLSDLINLKEP